MGRIKIANFDIFLLKGQQSSFPSTNDESAFSLSRTPAAEETYVAVLLLTENSSARDTETIERSGG